MTCEAYLSTYFVKGCESKPLGVRLPLLELLWLAISCDL